MAIKTQQETARQELPLAKDGSKNVAPIRSTDFRPLGLAELMQVAGGPTIENDNR